MIDNEEEYLSDEVYVEEGNLCPRCESALVEEQIIEYEKHSFCPHCDYFSTKSVE